MKILIKIFLALLTIAIFVTAFIFYNNQKNNGGFQKITAAPSDICSINAEILDVEKKNTTIEHYLVKVNILSISTFDNSGGGLPCDEDYIKNIEERGVIELLQSYKSNPLAKGQKIKAEVNFDGDEHFSGYFLRNITNL